MVSRWARSVMAAFLFLFVGIAARACSPPATASIRARSSDRRPPAESSSRSCRGAGASSAPRCFFSSSRRSRDAAVGSVGFRAPPNRRDGLSHLLEDPLGRELAVPELRALVLRRPRARPDRVARARADARASLRAPRSDSTSKSASTRVELFCACWPPGPLERENRNRDFRPNRLGVHGGDSARRRRGAARLRERRSPARSTRSRRLRAAGHRIRFVTNSTDACRARSSAESLRAIGLRRSRRRAPDDRWRRRARARRASGCWR